MKKITLILLKLFIASSIYAQCTAPSFNVNLSAKADTSWSLSGTSRAGICCGSSNCITFNLTLNPNTDLINFKVSNPAPSGAAFYQVNCGTPVSIGTPYCVSGVSSPMTITYCKPGGDHPTFTIIAGSVGKASDDITIRNTGCTDTLFVTNINPSSIVWTSIYPGAPGAYNSYLSCTAGCNSTLVSAKTSPVPPAYIDFQVSGAPNTLSCGTTCKDTVRVYFVNDMGLTVTPPSPVTCATSGAPVTLTANPTGGLAPYTYSWNTGSTSQSITTSSTGTYTVTVSDKTQCPSKTVTKTLAVQPVATFTYTAMYCKNLGSNPLPTMIGTGQAGTFTATPAGAVFVNANTGQIDLVASAANQYLVTNTVAATATCPGATATADLFVLPVPYMTSPSSAAICTGGTVSIPLTANFSSAYTWIASDNPNVSGESLTAQTSTTLSNTLINNTTINQIVTYTVTPTATIWGNCPGTPQTVTVTVRPKDDASFHYSSSTFCKTAPNPSPIITGITGGSFSGSAGLAIAAGSGNINLSSTAVGSYTVTYSVNNTCANTSTFPVTVTAGPSATFSYSSANYCQNAANPSPIFPAGSSAGSFNSTAGLVFVSNLSGQINLAASTPGTYTIVNSIAPSGGCALTVASATVTITKYNSPTFSYTGTPYCQNSSNPFPTFSGGSIAGIFSAPAGLSINSSTGEVNLSASTPGTYTVTNTIAANGGCTATSATASITITPLPITTFSYTGSPYCQNTSNPLPTFNGGGIAGTFTTSSVLLLVNSSSGLIDLAGSICDNYLVTNTIAAANGCPSVSTSVPVTITPLPIATFNYVSSPYCQNGASQTPVVDPGGTNGIFTGSSGSLNVEPNSGTLDLTLSSAGTYTVTNTVPAYNGCPVVVATANVTITSPTPGNFNYPATPYCKNGSNPSPSFTGGGVAGTFSAPAGLNINPATGVVDLATSAAGTYTVTNSTPPTSSCPGGIYTSSITITPLPVATFSYTASPYCQNGTNPSPTFSGGGVAGTFTSTAGLSINASTGVVNLAASTAGTYTVTNTIAAASGCPAVTATASITITPLPVATFSYTASPYCQNGTNPSPTFSGGGVAGTFTSTAGLSINASTGVVNLAASIAGTYTVTNTIAAASGCPVVTATASITITPLPIATFSYTASPYCQNGTNPSPTFSGGGVAGTFTSAAGLSINASTGVVNLAASTAGTYTVTNTIAAASGCPAVTATASITITPLPIATFSYTASPYCKNGTNPSPTFSGGGVAGTFTSTAGLSINASTGVVNLAASTAGTYTVTNTIAAASGCPVVTATASITITPLPVATFSYTASPYCQNGTNPSPTFSGGGVAGTFTSAAGLSINASTGVVNLVVSTAGTYTVTNTIAAASGCPVVTATANITITPLPVATFSYTASPYCKNGTNPSPTFSGGGVAGTFTSTAGLSINASTGVVNLAASTAGTYTVTNTIAAASGCPVVTATASITITPLPVATFSYTASPYCQNGTNPSPTFSGGGVAGTFTSAAGLSINASTGVVNLAASTAGTYTVTNTIAAASGCPAVIATASITITPLPVATFSYTGTPYCQNGSNPSPTFSGGGVAGTFSSTAGLNIDSSTGEINLAASTTGTYTVTNTIAAASGCPVVTATASITITPLPVATFSYTASPYCQNGTNPSPTFSGGGVAGTFTSAAGLIINASTGEINLAASTAGTYTITNTISAASGCPVVIETASVTITPLPIATFSYTGTPYCQNGTNPSPTFNGGGVAGTFTSTSGLNIDSSTGEINLAASTAGTYTVTNTISAASGCPAVIETVNITITPLPVGTFSYTASPYCQNGTDPSPTFNGGGVAGTFTSTAGLNINSSTGEINLAASTTGTYTVTNTIAAADGCPTVIENNSFTINPVATASAGSDASICEGSSYTLSGSIGGGASSLTWSSNGSGTFDDATSATATYTPSVTDITNGNVTLTLTTNDPAGPCSESSDAMVLTIEPAAIANASADAIICSGTVYTLSGLIGGGASSLTWTSNGSGTFDDNTSANAIYTPSSSDILSGSITLTITTNDPAGFCSSSSDNMILTINPYATADAGPDTNICSGNSYKLSGIIGGGATSLKWSSNGSGTFDDATSASATYTPSSADISVGNVILTILTDDPAGPCLAASDAMTLIINPIPTVDAGQDIAICSGNQYSLTGTIGGGASSANWVSNGSGTFDNSSNLSATYSPSVNDISNGSVLFTLITNDPAGACVSMNDTMVLTINPVATMNVGTDATICQGTEYSITGVIGGGASSFVWTSNGSGTFDNSSSANAIYTPSSADISAGSVILTGTSNDPAGPCSSVTDEMVLTITPRDNPSFTYSSSDFCETGSNPTPVISGATGGTFSVLPSSLAINSSTGTINLTGSSLGTYTVSYVTAGTCRDSSSVNINITNGLTADFNYASGAYCSNSTDPLPLLISGALNGTFSSTIGLVIDPSTGQVDLSASTPGTYVITNTVAASGGCAQASSTSSITINQLENPSFNYSASAFCHSSPNQLPIITGTPGGIFSCSASGLSLNASGEITVSSSLPGTYSVVYTTTGVCYNSDSTSVTINSLPVVNAGNERLIDCGANPIDLQAVDSLGTVINYSWNTAGGNILSGNTSNSASINQTGLYYVVATNTFGCTACDTVIVNESPIVPQAAFSSSPTELTGNAPFQVNFNNASQNANTYSWNFGDGSAGTSMMNPDYTFNTPGTYTVTLIASNNGRCTDTTDVVINVSDEFFIPEGFSPNGDGNNDLFEITGIERFKGNKLVIFNRWGNTVYEASPYTNQWDGKAKGGLKVGDDELPVSTYYYVLDLGDGSKPIKGYVYLNK
jgi:gliding motility-associated-like protein